MIVLSIFSIFAYSNCPVPSFEYNEINGTSLSFNEGDNYYACEKSFQYSKNINGTNIILHVYNSQFLKMIYNQKYGGAIYLLNLQSGTLQFKNIICNCTFEENKATKGGAIYIKSEYFRVSYTIIYCYFSKNGINSGKNEGSAIYFGSHDGRIEYCQFVDNGNMDRDTKGSIIYFLFHDRSTINNFVNITNNYFNYTTRPPFSSLFAFSSNQTTLFRMYFTNNVINVPEEDLSGEFYIFYGDGDDFYYNHVGNFSLQDNYYNVFDYNGTLRNPKFNLQDELFENNSVEEPKIYIPPLIYDFGEISETESSLEFSYSESSLEISSSESSFEISSSEIVPSLEISSSESSVEISSSESSVEISSSESSLEISSSESSVEISSSESSVEISSSESSVEISSSEIVPSSEIELSPSDVPYSFYCIVNSDGENETIFGRCNYSSTNKNTFVYIYDTSFTDLIENDEGGAVRLLECGVLCVNSNFTSCTSSSGCGGAVFVRNENDLAMNVTFENVCFSKCTALYGGASYIYISSEENELRFLLCDFVENKATAPKSSTSLFGGNALFLTVKNGYVSNCTFRKNKGSSNAVKFYNVFDKRFSNVDRLSEKVDSVIHVVNCNFVTDSKSESSIYFTNNKSGGKLEIVDCNFAGKLSKNKYYIDGELLDENSPKIRLSGCVFESKNAVDLDSNIFEKISVINMDSKSESKFADDSSIILCVSLLTATIIFVVITIIKYKSDDL